MRQLADTLLSNLTIPDWLSLQNIQVTEAYGHIRFQADLMLFGQWAGRFRSPEGDDDALDEPGLTDVNEALLEQALAHVTTDAITAMQQCPFANPKGTVRRRTERALVHMLYALLEPHIMQILLPLTAHSIIRQCGYADFYYLSFDDETPFHTLFTQGSEKDRGTALENVLHSYTSIVNSLERHELILNDPQAFINWGLTGTLLCNHRAWEPIPA